jgi:hypothetical protein
VCGCINTQILDEKVKSYQYDLFGFPVSNIQDKANRMKYVIIKYFKRCSTPNCKGITLNRKYHHFCCDCLLEFYQNNEVLSF